VKLPSPGLQSAGLHQGQVRHHRPAEGRRGWHLRGVHRRPHRLHQQGQLPLPDGRGDLHGGRQV